MPEQKLYWVQPKETVFKHVQYLRQSSEYDRRKNSHSVGSTTGKRVPGSNQRSIRNLFPDISPPMSTISCRLRISPSFLKSGCLWTLCTRSQQKGGWSLWSVTWTTTSSRYHAVHILFNVLQIQTCLQTFLSLRIPELSSKRKTFHPWYSGLSCWSNTTCRIWFSQLPWFSESEKQSPDRLWVWSSSPLNYWPLFELMYKKRQKPKLLGLMSFICVLQNDTELKCSYFDEQHGWYLHCWSKLNEIIHFLCIRRVPVFFLQLENHGCESC